MAENPKPVMEGWGIFTLISSPHNSLREAHDDKRCMGHSSQEQGLHTFLNPEWASLFLPNPSMQNTQNGCRSYKAVCWPVVCIGWAL